MIAASVSLNRANIQDKTAYTTLFAVEYVWPGLILLFILIVPESPYYLVSKGLMDNAYKQLKRLSNPSENIDLALERIVHLHEEEKRQRAASEETSFLDCFKGADWRRTRIILYCNGLPQVIGVTFLANGPYFMVQAGLSPQKTSMMIEVGIAFGIASSLIIFYVMSVVGFRTLTLYGLLVSTTFFTVIGIAGCFPHNSSALWYVLFLS
jgi:SP family general alpha glucoside:H+ symporter-like MFS transporter